MNDLWTMVWKESKDQVLQGGWQAWIRPLIFIGILGILLPANLGSQWLTLSPVVVLLTVYFSFIFIFNFIGDAIAGERERHTLETLLASRIADRAILLGKMIVTVGFAWGMSLACLLLGLVSANLSNGAGNWVFYTPLDRLLEILTLSLLACLLAASGGVLVSLWTATVRQAQQILTISTLVLGAVIIFGLKAVPSNVIASWSYNQLLLIAMLALAGLDAILLGISIASFHRSHLILT